MRLTKARKEVLDQYVQIVLKLGRRPTEAECSDYDLTRHMVRYRWKNPTTLDAYARKKFPEAYDDVPIENLFTKKRRTALSKDLRKYNRFLVTTAVAGCEIDDLFLSAMETYCEKNDAAILVLIAADPAAAVSPKGLGYIDKRLQKHHIISKDTALNRNVGLSTIKLSAKMIDPTTGLNRIGQRDGSTLYASPKQRLKLTPTSNFKIPHALMGTGAVTLPNYRSQRYMSQRTATIAEYDHVMGAIVVEVVDSRLFHFRQIQAETGGAFIDLGTSYSPDGTTEFVGAAALTPGDLHVGYTDPDVERAIYEVGKVVKPEYVLLHDFFTGASVDHHLEGRFIDRAKEFGPSLDGEVSQLAQKARELSEIGKLVVIKSNHDLWLDRYLQEFRFRDDPQNLRYALGLAAMLYDGYDPLAAEVDRLAPGAVHRWLKRDDDFIVAGIQHGAHGDKGPNGARGSLAAMERAYGKSVTGHSHTPEILRGAWVVGTSTPLRMHYTAGPSSWLQSMIITYRNGSRQLINVLEGEWRRVD